MRVNDSRRRPISDYDLNNHVRLEASSSSPLSADFKFLSSRPSAAAVNDCSCCGQHQYYYQKQLYDDRDDYTEGSSSTTDFVLTPMKKTYCLDMAEEATVSAPPKPIRYNDRRRRRPRGYDYHTGGLTGTAPSAVTWQHPQQRRQEHHDQSRPTRSSRGQLETIKRCTTLDNSGCIPQKQKQQQPPRRRTRTLRKVVSIGEPASISRPFAIAA